LKWTNGTIRDVVIKPINKASDSRGWLSELYRNDDVTPDLMPAMGYISITIPGIARGPHEHITQTDTFCFPGPGIFRITLWDRRSSSPTFGTMQTLEAGESNPCTLIVPPGIVHGYRNISNTDAMVLNFPNRLYRGPGKKEEVDEIRYENDPNHEFVLA
jgi:dTDP-4-dehydrorhamnose 3,5-epimerase